MEEYDYHIELERQRTLNEVYTKDKVILIRMITFFNNVEAKYSFDYCMKYCQKHKRMYVKYKKKMEAHEKGKNIY